MALIPHIFSFLLTPDLPGRVLQHFWFLSPPLKLQTVLPVLLREGSYVSVEKYISFFSCPPVASFIPLIPNSPSERASTRKTPDCRSVFNLDPPCLFSSPFFVDHCLDFPGTLHCASMPGYSSSRVSHYFYANGVGGGVLTKASFRASVFSFCSHSLLWVCSFSCVSIERNSPAFLHKGLFPPV